MVQDTKLQDLTGKVRELFQESLGEFRSRDFIQVADLLGFQAFEKTQPGSEIKPRAESNLPDIIGTNLEYAVHAYEWTTHMPMTEDRVIVSGFWDREKEPVPEGYGIVNGVLSVKF